MKETSAELQGVLQRVLKRDLEGDFRGDFKQDLEGDLLSSSGPQFRSGLASGPGQVQLGFSSKLKFNSLELDTETTTLYLKQHNNIDILEQKIKDIFLLFSECKFSRLLTHWPSTFSVSNDPILNQF